LPITTSLAARAVLASSSNPFKPFAGSLRMRLSNPPRLMSEGRGGPGRPEGPTKVSSHVHIPSEIVCVRFFRLRRWFRRRPCGRPLAYRRPEPKTGGGGGRPLRTLSPQQLLATVAAYRCHYYCWSLFFSRASLLFWSLSDRKRNNTHRIGALCSARNLGTLGTGALATCILATCTAQLQSAIRPASPAAAQPSANQLRSSQAQTVPRNLQPCNFEACAL
jgi:hypothetical protein